MFCNQCGTQIPDNSAVCSNCGATLGAPQAAPQPMQQPVEPQPQFNPQMGQPMPGQPMPGQQPMYNGQPMPGQQPMYNGQPMPGYGMPQQPQSNPLEFLTKKYPGQPFPMNGLFSVKNLISRITTIDLIGVIAAIFALIAVFVPFVKAYSKGYNLLSSELSEIGFKMGWAMLILSIAIGTLYAVRMEFMAFLCSCLYFVLFISAWAYGSVVTKMSAGSYHVGFWFALISSIVLVASPFIWKLIKKEK